MRAAVGGAFVFAALVGYACSSTEPSGAPSPLDAGSDDAASPSDASVADSADAPADAAQDADAGPSCFVEADGVTGRCLAPADCASLAGYEADTDAGLCASAADTCCTKIPNVADNPPPPAGWVLMPQASVTPDMTTWAVMILNDPVTYPMFSTAMKTFGGTLVLAVVEWHPPDFQNSAVHRGVTLYEQGD